MTVTPTHPFDSLYHHQLGIWQDTPFLNATFFVITPLFPADSLYCFLFFFLMLCVFPSSHLSSIQLPILSAFCMLSTVFERSVC